MWVIPQGCDVFAALARVVGNGAKSSERDNVYFRKGPHQTFRETPCLVVKTFTLGRNRALERHRALCSITRIRAVLCYVIIVSRSWQIERRHSLSPLMGTTVFSSETVGDNRCWPRNPGDKNNEPGIYTQVLCIFIYHESWNSRWQLHSRHGVESYSFLAVAHEARAMQKVSNIE